MADWTGHNKASDLVDRLGRSTGTVVLEGTGRSLIQRASSAGRAVLLLLDVLGHLHDWRRSKRQIFKQIELAGVGSLFVLGLIAGLTGFIMAVQTGAALAQYESTNLLGGIISVTFCREMGPIWAAIIILARVGAAMTAEIGTMVVNEEVDALRSMSISPVRFLVMPRFVALVAVMPVLTLIADFVGMGGGMLVAKTMFNQTPAAFMANVQDMLVASDIITGLVKSVFFGAIIAIIACDRGLSTSDGAEGVGRSTTVSVVLNIVFVLLADFVLTNFIQVVILGEAR